jgi:hypothetical protein
MFKVIDLGEEEKLSQVGDRSETLGISDSGWRTLYKLAGVAILLAVVIFRRNCAAEFDLFRGFGIFNVPEVIPVRSMDWFKLLQEDPFVGLVLLDVIDLVNYAIVGLTFLALYGALRGTRGIATKVATIFGLVGVTVYFHLESGIFYALPQREICGSGQCCRARPVLGRWRSAPGHEPGHWALCQSVPCAPCRANHLHRHAAKRCL